MTRPLFPTTTGLQTFHCALSATKCVAERDRDGQPGSPCSDNAVPAQEEGTPHHPSSRPVAIIVQKCPPRDLVISASEDTEDRVNCRRIGAAPLSRWSRGWGREGIAGGCSLHFQTPTPAAGAGGSGRGGGLAQGLGIRLFAFGGAYWPLATAHSDPLWAQTCFGCVNGAPG